jgi:nicotinamide mononucleotide (NMN) deamidase PncC
MIAPIADDVRRRLGDFVYAEGQRGVEDVAAELLARCGQTVAVVEAGTQGDVGQRLAATAQAAAVFAGARLETDLAAEPDELALRARQEAGADWGLAVVVSLPPEATRLALALAGPGGVETQTLGFGGHPALATRWAGTAALNLLRLRLLRQAREAPA